MEKPDRNYSIEHKGKNFAQTKRCDKEPGKPHSPLMPGDITQLFLQFQPYSIPTLLLYLLFLVSIVKKFNNQWGTFQLLIY